MASKSAKGGGPGTITAGSGKTGIKTTMTNVFGGKRGGKRGAKRGGRGSR